MNFRAFELAVDILLSRSSGPVRSVFELPGTVVQRAHQDSLSPEEFVQSLQERKTPSEKTRPSQDQTGDLFS